MIGNRVTYRPPQTDTIFQINDTAKIPLLFIKLANPLSYQKKQGNRLQIVAETTNELFIAVDELRVEETPDMFGIFKVNPKIPPHLYRIGKNDRKIYLIDQFYNDLLDEYSSFPHITTIGNKIFLQKNAQQIKQLIEKPTKSR